LIIDKNKLHPAGTVELQYKQAIETSIKQYHEKYSNDKLQPMFEQCDLWQEIININGKGDNLRLFAQKGA
jgi:hypothetical protein